ncbi:MAG TPA: hypothetical protein VHU80_06825 [Polyangiaceae bacterium]|nr:hypothetical protein [Polyangiaceae bacterium]
MSVISPEFSFAEYWSFDPAVLGQNFRPVPPTPDAFANVSMEGKYVYAFGEVQGKPTPWELVEAYKLSVVGPSIFPTIQVVAKQSGPDAEELLGDPVQAVSLPVDQSGGTADRKYYFLALPHPLDLATVSELEKERPDPLPVVLLRPASPHFRLVKQGDDGKIVYVKELQGATRVLFVVEPYSALRHIADVYEFRCDLPSRFVRPEAAYSPAERAATEERLAKFALAREIDALRKAGNDIDGSLKSRAEFNQFLADMDPHQENGELAKRIKNREDSANAIVLITTSKLWDLLDRDARSTDARAGKYYDQHLEISAYAHRRLPDSELGLDFWNGLAEKFPMKASDQARAVPTTAMEFVAANFVYAEHLDQPVPWHDSVLPGAATSLISLHGGIANVLARRARDDLTALTGVLRPDAAFEDWVTKPMRTQMGLTAYRWAYHLRSAFALEKVTLENREQIVSWTDVGGVQQMNPIEIEVNFDKQEFSSKFPASKVHLDHVLSLFSLVSAVFTAAALKTAIDQKKRTAALTLRTGSAMVSLMGSQFVMDSLGKFELLAAGRPALALRWAGAAGAGLGALADAIDAANTWEDTGEGDVTLAKGASAFGGLLVAWGGGAAALGSAGPPGWVVLAGLSLVLVAPLVVVMVQDTDVEKMVDHSVFGSEPGANHVAPGLAVCPGGRFSAWPPSGIPSLELQLRGFENATWTFAVAGVGTPDPHPTLRLTPQRIIGTSGFEIGWRVVWTSTEQAPQPGVTPDQVVQEGKVFLHVGIRTSVSIETLAGMPFSNDTVKTAQGPRPVLVHGDAGGRSFFDWTFVLHSPDEAFGPTHFRVEELTLTIVLHPNGKDDSLVIPMAAPGDAPRSLKYTLLKNVPISAFSSVLHLNTDESLSTSAYS